MNTPLTGLGGEMASISQTGGNPDRSFVRKAMKAPMLEAEHELNLARRWRDHED